MLELVHHDSKAGPGTPSVFLQHAHELAKGSDVCISSPYIGLNVFLALVANARSWRFLTDANELLRNAQSRREEVIEFLAKHADQVRHLDKLHAKVVVSDNGALIGSANFTEMGMCQRHEMAVRLDDSTLIRDVQTWFDDLWKRCSAPAREEMQRFADSLPTRADDPPAAMRIQSTGPVLSFALSALRDEVPNAEPQAVAKVKPEAVAKAKATETQAEKTKRLIDRIAQAPSRDWIDSYLDLCADLLKTLDISNDAPCLAMTVRKSEKNLVININQRWALVADLEKGGEFIQILLPYGFEIPNSLASKYRVGSFKKQTGEKAEAVPKPCRFDHPRELAALRDPWLLAVRREVDLNRKSSLRDRYHVNAFYRAAFDREYRASLLNAAFPRNHLVSSPRED